MTNWEKYFVNMNGATLLENINVAMQVEEMEGCIIELLTGKHIYTPVSYDNKLTEHRCYLTKKKCCDCINEFLNKEAN